MKEERLKILKMVEDGKISVDDAMKLLDSLKAQGPDDNNYYGFQGSEFEDKMNRFSQAVDDFAKDVGDRMTCAFKDMEPKLRQATKTVVEKTANVVDDISKSLNESLKTMEERAENAAQQAEEQMKEQKCDCENAGCCEDAGDQPKEN